MADVLQKVIDANVYVNGASIVGSDKIGNIEKLAHTINDNTGIGAISGVLDTRFDDVRYYTGDAIT
jgi:hypothetical protein